MLGFLFGVLVGALGFWAYRFWKGEEDTSWDQPFSSGGMESGSYGGQSSSAVGSGTKSSSAGTESTTTPNQ